MHLKIKLGKVAIAKRCNWKPARRRSFSAFTRPITHLSVNSTIPLRDVPAVASPGFVARRGKGGNYAMGHSRWTSGPAAAAAR